MSLHMLELQLNSIKKKKKNVNATFKSHNLSHSKFILSHVFFYLAAFKIFCAKSSEL